jgi:hypothetical protein
MEAADLRGELFVGHASLVVRLGEAQKGAASRRNSKMDLRLASGLRPDNRSVSSRSLVTNRSTGTTHVHQRLFVRTDYRITLGNSYLMSAEIQESLDFNVIFTDEPALMTPQERIREALSHLRLVEWECRVWGRGTCPICGQCRPVGHSDDCELGMAINVLNAKQQTHIERRSMCYTG